jgi:hypothetical protein
MSYKSIILSLFAFAALLPMQNASADQITGYFWIQNGCWARHTDGTFTSTAARSCPTKVTQQMRDAAFGPIDEVGEFIFFGIVVPAIAGGPYLDQQSKRADYSRPISASE